MPTKKNNSKGLSIGELKKNLDSAREKLHELRFKSEGSKSKNVKEAWALRKQVARVLTEMNKK